MNSLGNFPRASQYARTYYTSKSYWQKRSAWKCFAEPLIHANFYLFTKFNNIDFVKSKFLD